MTALDLGAIARALGGEVSGRRVLAPGPEQPPVRSASTKPVGRTDWKEVARAAWEAPSWREAALDYHKNRPTSPQPSERLLIPEREIPIRCRPAV